MAGIIGQQIFVLEVFYDKLEKRSPFSVLRSPFSVLRSPFSVTSLSIVLLLIIFLIFSACSSGTTDPSVHNHTWGAWIVTKAANCTEPGIETRTCSLDSSHTETRDIDALGHDHTESLICKRSGCSHQYAKGDIGPGGGKIFYVANGLGGNWSVITMTDNNQKCYYLEAAPGGWYGVTAPSDPKLMWQSALNVITDTEQQVLGSGRRNTALINAHTDTTPAASACYTYTNNGKNDWFLPSIDELRQFFINQGYVDSFINDIYWSSSQSDMSSASNAYRHFAGGYNALTKTNSYYVRPIRAF